MVGRLYAARTSYVSIEICKIEIFFVKGVAEMLCLDSKECTLLMKKKIFRELTHHMYECICKVCQVENGFDRSGLLRFECEASKGAFLKPLLFPCCPSNVSPVFFSWQCSDMDPSVKTSYCRLDGVVGICELWNSIRPVCFCVELLCENV